MAKGRFALSAKGVSTVAKLAATWRNPNAMDSSVSKRDGGTPRLKDREPRVSCFWRSSATRERRQPPNRASKQCELGEEFGSKRTLPTRSPGEKPPVMGENWADPHKSAHRHDHDQIDRVQSPRKSPSLLLCRPHSAKEIGRGDSAGHRGASRRG